VDSQLATRNPQLLVSAQRLPASQRWAHIVGDRSAIARYFCSTLLGITQADAHCRRSLNSTGSPQAAIARFFCSTPFGITEVDASGGRLEVRR
jgi:hypothetical protein